MANGDRASVLAATASPSVEPETPECGPAFQGIALPSSNGSGQTPLIISTMGEESDDGGSGDGGVTTLTADRFSDCPWPLVLLAIILAFMLTRGGG